MYLACFTFRCSVKKSVLFISVANQEFVLGQRKLLLASSNIFSSLRHVKSLLYSSPLGTKPQPTAESLVNAVLRAKP